MQLSESSIAVTGGVANLLINERAVRVVVLSRGPAVGTHGVFVALGQWKLL
jgi:hypothetical protein